MTWLRCKPWILFSMKHRGKEEFPFMQLQLEKRPLTLHQQQHSPLMTLSSLRLEAHAWNTYLCYYSSKRYILTKISIPLPMSETVNNARRKFVCCAVQGTRGSVMAWFLPPRICKPMFWKQRWLWEREADAYPLWVSQAQLLHCSSNNCVSYKLFML